MKYDLALQKNLKGIGIWAIGDDGSRDELWNLIEKKFGAVSSVNNISPLPSDFILYQNYPNPFNPTTTIEYVIPSVETGYIPSLHHVTLKIYDILGREIATLVNEHLSPGKYSVQFNVGQISNMRYSLPSGIYFYKLQSGQYSAVHKMILLK
ncbi:MAG: T9SS type A sorting domain-containing protein [Ignavibacteriales bacterium]|nr:T9SS type A sorting domain-containing protein [Ignavibacteriales bacterium]